MYLVIFTEMKAQIKKVPFLFGIIQAVTYALFRLFFFFLVKRMNIQKTTITYWPQRPKQWQHAYNNIAHSHPHQAKHLNHQRGGTKNIKIFHHGTAPLSRKINAVIRLSKHMPHSNLHELSYERPAITQQRGFFCQDNQHH